MPGQAPDPGLHTTLPSPHCTHVWSCDWVLVSGTRVGVTPGEVSPGLTDYITQHPLQPGVVM